MKRFRLSGWLIATVVLLVAIALLAPQQLPVSLYKLSLVSMAGVAGYWLDRELFPYARPDSFVTSGDDENPFFDYSDSEQDLRLIPWDGGVSSKSFLFGVSMIRRALIVGCAMLAIGLGA